MDGGDGLSAPEKAESSVSTGKMLVPAWKGLGIRSIEGSSKVKDVWLDWKQEVGLKNYSRSTETFIFPLY